jgi:glycyl-tRNA synthetase beta subunit
LPDNSNSARPFLLQKNTAKAEKQGESRQLILSNQRMALPPNFYANLQELDSFRDDPAWERFFECIKRLEEIDDEIEDAMHEGLDTPELNLEANSLVEELDGMKDALGQLTVNSRQFDAVYECVSILRDHFPDPTLSTGPDA